MSNSSERKAVISGLFWKFSEIFCTDGVSFIISTLLARMLMPEQYGQIALVNIFIVLANEFVVHGLGTALIQKKNADNLDFSSVLYFNFLVSLVLYGILFLAAPYVAAFYEDPMLTSILRVLGLKIPLASISSVQNAYISRNMLFKKLFVVNVTSTISSGAVGIWMAYQGYGVWALVGQILISSLSTALVTAIVTKWIPILKCSWGRLKGLINYGWKILASSLIKTGYALLVESVIGKKYSSSDLAFYSRGKKYPGLIVDAINTSISSVMFPAMAKRQDDPQRLREMVGRSIRTSTYILSPLLLGLAALAEPIICFMLTEKWLPCVPYLRLSCISCALMPIQTANLQAIRAVGRSDIVLKLDVIKRGIGVLLLLFLMNYGPLYVVLAYVIMDVISIVINITPNVKLIEYSYKKQMGDLIPNLLLSLSMAAVVYGFYCFTKPVLGNGLVMTVAGVGVGAVYYIGVSVLIKNESFLYVWGLIKQYLPNRKRK